MKNELWMRFHPVLRFVLWKCFRVCLSITFYIQSQYQQRCTRPCKHCLPCTVALATSKHRVGSTKASRTFCCAIVETRHFVCSGLKSHQPVCKKRDEGWCVCTIPATFGLNAHGWMHFSLTVLPNQSVSWCTFRFLQYMLMTSSNNNTFPTQVNFLPGLILHSGHLAVQIRSWLRSVSLFCSRISGSQFQRVLMESEDFSLFSQHFLVRDTFRKWACTKWWGQHFPF